jgi:ABC-type multidrug transport system fused ATPase/permease subunit
VAERTPSEAIGTLIWAVVILFVANVVGYVLWLISDNMSVRLSCRIEQRFIQGAFAHVLKLPLEFFSKRSSSAIAKQIDQSEEVSGIVTAVSQQILPELISLVGILLIMFWQNARLTLVALAVIPAYLFIAWRSSQRLETGLNTYYERWEEVSGRIQSALSGIKTVKLSGAERREVARYAQISDEAYANYVERSRLSNRYTFWQGVLTHLSTALVLGYGGYLALVHKLTPGDVVMFVSYLDRLYSPIGELTSLWVNLQLNIASISRAFKLLDQNEEEPAGREFVPSRGEIRFENVRFGYTEEREVLKGVSLRFAPGRITAIVGSSGAGKTTTVDLLLKLYDVTSGDISIDGRSILDADPASVRRQIGMVSADSAIFRGTVADNIRYRKADATDGELMDAVKKSGLDGLVNRLPEDLATQVGQNGIGLSVGERQRIQIARVLVSKPGILVLDEATANLDYNTESTIREAVEAMKHDCTIVVIAHRYSMVRNADYVYVLRDGEVIEEGTPGDLIGRNGWFTGFATAAEEDTGTGEESAEPDEISDDELVEETEDA